MLKGSIRGTLQEAGRGIIQRAAAAEAASVAIITDGVLNENIDFSRSTTGTYIDSAGVMQTEAIDSPRLDYDPVTLELRGLLVEAARTNVITNSEAFTGAAGWTANNCTVSADAAAAPDAATTADTIIESATTAQHYVQWAYSKAASSIRYTYSVYIKPAGRTTVVLGLNGGGGAYGYFTLTGSGSLTSAPSAGSGYSAERADIEECADGWYRCKLTVTADSTLTTIYPAIYPNSSLSYAGDGASGVHAWGAQLEESHEATSYIPTASTTVTRAADICQSDDLAWLGYQVPGTFVGEFEGKSIQAGSGLSHYLVRMSIGGVTNVEEFSCRLHWNTFQHLLQVQVRDDSAQVVGMQPSVAGLAAIKAAAAINDDDYEVAVNGSSLDTDTAGTAPTDFTRLEVGGSLVNTESYLNSRIKSLSYYPQRLSQAEMETLTA